MIKVSIMYPNSADKRFDFEYYQKKHIPLAIKLLGAHPGYKGISVERGQSGGAPGSEPAYVAVCHFTFTSVQDFIAAFKPNAEELQADIINYTDIEPVTQFSSVEISESQ